MTARSIALVARADSARSQIARYLRDGGYDVIELEDLAIPSRFIGLVVIDDQEAPAERMRTRVQSWVKLAKSQRIVVVTSKPAAWKALALANLERMFVLAAPAFGWEIVDALRASVPDEPRRV